MVTVPPLGDNARAVERRVSSAGEPCLRDHAWLEWIATTHERCEVRHREVDEPKVRTEDQALLDQRVAVDRRPGAAAEPFDDISGTIRAIANIGHRRHVAAFSGRRLFEAHVEELIVQLAPHEWFGGLDIIDCDRRARRHVPDLFAIGLNERGVAARQLNDPIERCWLIFDALGRCRLN